MKKIITSLSIIFLIFITGCGQSKEVKQKKELEKLAKEVMDIHDRTMDQDHYGKLRPLKKQLLEIESIQTDSLIKNDLVNASLELENADNDMMDWMHQYKAPEDFLPFDEQKLYYVEEKRKIEEIEKRTNLAMDHAKELIDKYSK